MWYVHVTKLTLFNFVSIPLLFQCFLVICSVQANIYLAKFNNRNNRNRCDIFSKLTRKNYQDNKLNNQDNKVVWCLYRYLYIYFIPFSCFRCCLETGICLLGIEYREAFNTRTFPRNGLMVTLI